MKNSRGAKKDVRLILFVTESMDEKLEEMAREMELTKQEYIRYVLGQSLLSVKIARETIGENVKNASSRNPLQNA